VYKQQHGDDVLHAKLEHLQSEHHLQVAPRCSDPWELHPGICNRYDAALDDTLHVDCGVAVQL